MKKPKNHCPWHRKCIENSLRNECSCTDLCSFYSLKLLQIIILLFFNPLLKNIKFTSSCQHTSSSNGSNSSFSCFREVFCFNNQRNIWESSSSGYFEVPVSNTIDNRGIISIFILQVFIS